jgi:excisionase family DNA binding protein
MNEEFLSTRQVQLRLNVDRTTVYRMLKDGRLKGVKIGRQWRFPQHQIDALLTGSHPTQTTRLNSHNNYSSPELQNLLDVFAETLAIGLHAISTSGKPLTTTSNPCRFCLLIQSSKSGKKACQAQWTQLANGSQDRKYSTCHAGLNYAKVQMVSEGTHQGYIVAGQFYSAAPDSREHIHRIDRLAKKYKLNSRNLAEAAADLTILPASHRALLWDWIQKIADSFAAFSQKQQALNFRLQQIAQMCDLNL